ncbi:hypothetical protein [uncultured Clostridium sp.]|jgi:hypothetical protein|uniref:hypothetical protein n=2 Tax=uncultured Clostridium sp. TaxID=59620 RepID=UPI00261D2B93|nr:hypothetical protein [uncultured Clostridium sp.]
MKRRTVIILFLSVVIFSFGSYFFVKYDFEKVKEIKVTRDNYNKGIDFEYEIEDIVYCEKDVIITGWIAEVNDNNKYINRNIILKNEEEIIAIKTEAKDFEYLKLKNTTKTNYNKCGIIGRVKNNKLLKNENYQIGFIITNEDKRETIIFTDKFIEIS